MIVAGHNVRIITDQFIYIEEHPDETPIAVDAEKFLKKLRFKIGPLDNRKIFYKDRFGSCDEIVSSSNGICHFRSVPAETQLKIHKMLNGKL